MVDAELVYSFVAESRDMLDDVEPVLIEMQQIADDTGEVDTELVNMIFRLFHSMKGSAGFLQFHCISSVTHEAETLLDLFRKGKATISTSHTALLCETIDFVREVMDSIEQNFTDEGFENESNAVAQKIAGAITQVSGKKRETTVLTEKKSAQKTVRPSVEEVSSGSVSANNSETQNKPKKKNMEIIISDEMAKSFIQEADEQLDIAEARLAELQDSETMDDSLLAEAYRCVHSFKGNCGFMGYGDMEGLSHKAENLLDLIVNGRLDYDEECSSMLLKIIDILIEAVAGLSKGGDGRIQGWEVMAELLDEVASGADGVEEGASGEAAEVGETSSDANYESIKESNAAPVPVIAIIDDNESIRNLMSETLSRKFSCSLFSTAIDALQKIKGKHEFSLIVTDMKMPGMDGIEFIEQIRNVDMATPILVVTAYGDKNMLVKLVDLGVDEFLDKPFDIEDFVAKVDAALLKGEERKSAKKTDRKTKALRTSGKNATVARKDIRVDLDKLDMLINLVGELVIAEAMVTNNPDLDGMEMENFERASHHLRRITMDLQDVSMSVRMVPLSGTFRKMVRLVHDLSVKAGKQVKLELKGEDTEVDKTVIEQIADPLVHIVRNSVDHGQEPTAERVAAGKSEIGLVSIEARHEGGEVWILIQDDGRGLDKDKILNKAIERGIVTGDGANLRDDEIFKLIFEPGFSTADKITDVSGRGVGMDVVKKNIEKLKGRVDIRSVYGKGTTIILRIPLTLAIIDGMLVRVSDNKYTLPLLSIKESLRPEKQHITRTMDGQEVISLRDELIPVIRLHEFFNKTPEFNELEDGILIVIEDNQNSYCLFIDEIIGQQQTVIKGLSNYIGNARGISGCTILGDGSISLILDLGGLVEMAIEEGLVEKDLDRGVVSEECEPSTALGNE